MRIPAISHGFAWVLLACGVPAQPAAAAPVTIGDGIAYVRIHHLSDDLDDVANATEVRAAIVDARFVSSDLTEALRLGGLLARRTGGIVDTNAEDKTLIRFNRKNDSRKARAVLVLVNHATSGPIEAVLDALQTEGDVLVVGTRTAGDTRYRRPDGEPDAGSAFVPGLLVDTTPELDTAAYTAFDTGTTAIDLLDALVDKPRFDEARLLQEHVDTNGRTLVPRPGSPPPSSGEATAEKIGATGAPIRDRTLQHAVNSIRAAEALGRL